jgi:FMN reductase
MARAAVKTLERMGIPAEFADLRDVDMPICTGDDDLPISASELREKIRGSLAVIVAAPVYNFDVNAAAKNLIEITGSAWNGKVVGLMAAAGGRSSYMALMGFANSLVLDFRCWIVPRFVYATDGDAPDADELPQPIAGRVEQLARITVAAANALASVE